MEEQGPSLINMSHVPELPTAGSNLNHRFKVKDQGRIYIGDSNLVGSSN